MEAALIAGIVALIEYANGQSEKARNEGRALTQDELDAISLKTFAAYQTFLKNAGEQ